MRLNPKVRDVMTPNPICAPPEATIESVARLMADTNCGEIPICKDGKVVGVITDRDIACRAVGRGLDPAKTWVREVMTVPPITVDADEPLKSAIELMESKKVRRLPVVDVHGTMVGIISQVDVAARVSQRKAGHMLAKLARAES